MHWFERYLAFHCWVQLVHRHYFEVKFDSSFVFVPADYLAIALATLGFGLIWKYRRLGLASCSISMLVSVIGQHPFSANHAGWSLVVLSTLTLLSGNTTEDRHRAGGYIFVQSLVIVFWTGVQKLWYGTYFQGEFLMVMARIRPTFAPLVRLVVSPQEWEMITSQPLTGGNSVVWRSTSPLMLVASNAVWIFEIAAPFFVFVRRIRVWVLGAIMLFLLSIQVAATEYVFAGLAIGVMAFGLPWRVHRWILGAFVALLGGFFLANSLGIVGARAWN